MRVRVCVCVCVRVRVCVCVCTCAHYGIMPLTADLLLHKMVSVVSFTGSEQLGNCGMCTRQHIKCCTSRLGGREREGEEEEEEEEERRRRRRRREKEKRRNRRDEGGR